MPSLEILDATVISPSQVAPLHQQVHALLQGAIEEHFEDGQSFWTEKLLIERLGVSRITVRHALGELTREGMLVREALRGSYVRKTAVTTLGIIFLQSNSDFLSEMIQKCAAQCLERNLRLELYPLWAGTSPQELASKIRHLPTEERLILMVGDDSSKELYCLLQARGYTVLSLDELSEPCAVPSVITNSRLAVRMAIEHLVSQGHERITFLVNEPTERASIVHKMAQCQLSFAELGLSQGRIVDCGTKCGQSSFEKAYQAMPALWQAPNRSTAIFTASDPGAWAALRWLGEQKIEVPDEISILGFEGVKPDAFTHPPLTTVAHDLDELARLAIDALWQPDGKIQQIPPRLIVRQSTGPCPD